MSDAVRVAVIGYGVAGAVFHGPLLAADDGFEVVAVVTSDPRRQAAARTAHPSARVLARAQDLWEAADELQPRLAVVATPNSSHVPLAEDALGAGLDVVVDKPLAPDAAAAAGLVEAAQRAGRLLTVFQNRRWDGDLLTIRGLLADGSLGEIWRLESRFERWRPSPRPDSWREQGSVQADGAGMLLDLGSHLVDQALQLLGPPATVYGEIRTRRPGVQADDDAFVALSFPGGATAHLSMGAAFAAPGPRFRVLGSAGAYVKPGLDVQEDQLRAGLGPRDAAFGVEPEELWGTLVTGEQVRPVPTRAGRYAEFYAVVRAALLAGTAAPVDPRDAVRTLRVLDAARESSATGCVVPLVLE